MSNPSHCSKRRRSFSSLSTAGLHTNDSCCVPAPDDHDLEAIAPEPHVPQPPAHTGTAVAVVAQHHHLTHQHKAPPRHPLQHPLPRHVHPHPPLLIIQTAPRRP